jgi:hypothetical protein
MDEHTKPSPETRAEEREEAKAAHEPDRPPTADEEAAAADLKIDADAAEHYEEMAERGAKQQGEGRIP